MRNNPLTRLFFAFIVSVCALLFSSAQASAEPSPLPRTLIALYNSDTQDLRYLSPHLYLEMPANHLGYDMVYADVNEPLPELSQDIRGIVIWLNEGESVPSPERYLHWVERAIDSGRKVVLIGDLGLPDSYTGSTEGFAHLNRVLGKLGLVDQSRWINLTYDAQVTYQNPKITGFEREYGAPLPPYRYMQALDDRATSHMQLSNSLHEGSPADMIVTSPAGGYIASGYAMYRLIVKTEEQSDDDSDEEDDERIKFLQWYVNPFTFLRLALEDGELPKPDITTLAGQRIFYSHMDGDGWNNLTEVEAHRKKQITSAEVIYLDIFKHFAEFPFSVGIIAGEMKTECYGAPGSEELAREILRLPNAEPGSHTYSHPFYWEFFDGRTPEQEVALLKYHPPRPTHNIRFLDHFEPKQHNPWEAYGVNLDDVAESAPYYEEEIMAWLRQEDIDPKIMDKYSGRPRGYACTPFDLEYEIAGAAEYINSLAPEGKKVKLVQWSGDTSPYEDALRLARENNLFNINGGDSRFDDEYPSYASVAPIGLQVGKERQIYSSNSNENTYTKLWTDRFFGFRYLQTTVNNTESPWRVAPFNVYFHTYSGEREASLNALRENLQFAQTKEIIPIFTSQYAAIANGFYTTQIVPIAKDTWKILNRGALQTIRFDQATLKSVDFKHSEGVIGQRHYQGSLYVALHPHTDQPVIALKKHDNTERYDNSNTPYLIKSRWQIIDLQKGKNSLIIHAQGFGAGEMHWKMPKPGPYTIKTYDGGTLINERVLKTDDNGLLVLLLDTEAVAPVEIIIEAR